MLNYALLQSAPLATSPFSHLVVPHFISPSDLDAVVAGLPQVTKGGSYPASALKLGLTAMALLGELASPKLREVIGERFDLNLRDAPTMITLRGQSRDKDGRIHRDSDTKRVTVLLYLNPRSATWAGQEGCLRLLHDSSNIENYAVEVPPVDGTLLVFPNSSVSWHGHLKFVGRRYVVQLNYMSESSAARAELRRHHVSAMLKRLIAA